MGVIYNPKAGSRKAQKRWQTIRAYMDECKVKYDYVQSEGLVRLNVWQRHWLTTAILLLW